LLEKSDVVEKKHRLVVEVESLASSSKKLRRVDVKTAASSWKKIWNVDELSIKKFLRFTYSN